MSNRPLDRDNMYWNLGDPTSKVVESLLELRKDFDEVDLTGLTQLGNDISVLQKKTVGAVSVTEYGATGSVLTTTGSISSGSTSFTTSDLKDFKAGHGVLVKGGVKHVKTYTITGTATAAGTMSITPITGNPTVLTASILVGDTANTIAQNLRSAANTWGEWTVSGTGNQVVITAADFGAKAAGLFDTGGTGATIAGANTTTGTVLEYTTKITSVNTSTKIITLQDAASSAGNSGTTLYHDDVAALRQAQTAAISLGASELKFPKGTYCISDTIVLDHSKVKWVGSKAKIKFVGSADVPIISVTASGNANPYTQKDVALAGFEIYGTGKTRNTGIHFEGPNTSNTVSAIDIYANVHDVKYGMVFYSNAYLIKCYVDTWNCAIGAYLKNGGTNYGENIQLLGSLYNNDLAMQNDIPGGEFFCRGASIDFNTKLAVLNNGGKIHLDTCHVEYTSNASIPIELRGDGAVFNVSGGTFVAGGSTLPDYIIYCDAGNNGGASFDKVVMGTLNTNTDKFANVIKGIVKVDPFLNSVPNMPRITSDKHNKLVDGGFEKTTIVDEIFISSDTGTITNPLTGTNISLATDTAQFRSGVRSLKATKTAGSGLPSKFCIAVPTSHYKKLNFRLYYKKPGTGAGTLAVVPAFAKIVYDSNGVGKLKNIQYQGSGTSATLTSAAVDWALVQSDATTVTAPAWASHYLVEISMDWVTADSIFFDDIFLGEM